MRIVDFIKKTSGGLHGWFEAEHGGRIFNIRKPLDVLKKFPELVLPKERRAEIEREVREKFAIKPLPEYKPGPARRTRWQRFVDWILRRAKAEEKQKVEESDTIKS